MAIAEGVSAPFTKLSIVRSILRELDSVIQIVLSCDNAKILDMWRKYSVTLGRKVGFRLKDTEYTGTAVDITPDGKLSVDCSDGARRDLLSGEVSVNGIYGYR
jgi:BirA family biotin operon repressor/biotin-[acetyl-CoA-carboxylase] ligase